MSSRPSSPIAFSVPYTSCALSDQACRYIHEFADRPCDLRAAATQMLQNLRAASASSFLMLTSSCTHALQLSALAMDLLPGDEVILPSFTYAATANAFAATGATLVFADLDPADMNLCPASVSRLLSAKTKAIVPIHYGGRAADMDALRDLCRCRSDIFLVEDAAHGIGASFRGIPLGSMGHMGAISFHATKNITAGGNGGLLLLNSSCWQKNCQQKSFQTQLQDIYTQGTNRQAFFAGEASCYTWQRLGGAFEPSPYVAAFLLAALADLESVTEARLALLRRYEEGLADLARAEKLTLPHLRPGAQQNGHNFYILLPDANKRLSLDAFLQKQGIDARTHYEPLHLSRGAKRYGKIPIPLTKTENLVPRLLRLPLHHALSEADVDLVVEAISQAVK